MNGGTITKTFPLGGAGGRAILEREKLANAQAILVCGLCTLLHQHGYFFTIENPYDSHLWLAPVMVTLMEFVGVKGCLVMFDQCAFGLQLPGASKHCFCRKRTCIFTNNLKLKAVAVMCPGLGRLHTHDHAWGSVRVNGKTLSNAAAAGRYPTELCRQIAAFNAEAIRERFWGNSSPWRRDEHRGN